MRDFGEEAAANYAAGVDGDFTATLVHEDMKMTNVKTHSVFMVLKDTGLCEHSSYNGGSEKRFPSWRQWPRSPCDLQGSCL